MLVGVSLKTLLGWFRINLSFGQSGFPNMLSEVYDSSLAPQFLLLCLHVLHLVFTVRPVHEVVLV